MKPKRVVAVVPAKLTSVRLPQKNLAPIEGQALFAYSIRAALKSTLIDEVVVSSESGSLLATAGALGARTVLRPESLSGSKVTNQTVLAHVLDELEQQGAGCPEVIVLLQPTHPFRVPADIDAAIALLGEHSGFSSIFALRADPRLFGHLDAQRFVPDVPLPRQRDRERTRYENTGAFYILDVAKTVQAGSFFGDRIGGFALSRPELEIDIDEPIDLKIARAMARYYRHDLESLGLLDRTE